MTKPTVFLGADHAGFELKNKIREHLVHQGYTVEDEGAEALDPADDYPQYAYAVATKVLGQDGSRGVLLCGSAQGMAIAANRVHGIRAAVGFSQAEARETRQDNDTNVLVLASRYLDEDTALSILDNWLEEPFSGEERHVRRIKQIEELYG